MSQQLISLSPDLKRLRDEGYEIELGNGFLIIHHIPYVNNVRQILFGKLIIQLTLNNNITTKPPVHTLFFMGSRPCNKDGSLIEQIYLNDANKPLFNGIVMNFMFSNKPLHGYNNYYHQAITYINIISSPAYSIDKSVTAQTYIVMPDKDEEVFQYYDTNASRANIYAINSKLREQKIAIIGLGGTGSYILDFVSKSPVTEIHLFDSDVFLQHNAFRFPGAATAEELGSRYKKVEYLAGKYLKMHKGVRPHSENITERNIGLLDSMTYVFVCIDNNEARKTIIDHLLKEGISFIDVGLGVNTVDTMLIGQVRVTVGTPKKNDHISSRIPFTINDDNNEYGTNIQIGELNALNAVLAVIKWKKLSGFYQDLEEEYNCTYSINVAQLLNDDLAA